MMVFFRKTTICLAMFLCVSAINSVCVGAIVDVAGVRASSELIDSPASANYRVAANLIDFAAGSGFSFTTGLYSHNNTTNWMTDRGLTTNVWLAFDLTNPKDIYALSIWNLTQSGNLGRDVGSMEMLFLTDTSGKDFSTYDFSVSIGNLLDDGFKSVGQPIQLVNKEIAGGVTNSQLVNVSAEQATWVVFKDIVAINPAQNIVGLSKLMFLDKAPAMPNLGVAPAKAAAYSSRDSERNVGNLVTGQPYYRPLTDGSFVSSHYFANGTSWMSNDNSVANGWLAFELSEPMNLAGLNIWNFAMSVDNQGGYGHEWQRGVKDFDVYTLTSADVEKLTDMGKSFDTIFTEYTTFSALLLDLKDWLELDDPLPKRGSSPEGGLQGGAGLGTRTSVSDMEYVPLDAPMSNVAWVILGNLANFYPDGDARQSTYVGMGHVQFVEASLFDDENGVPEPATWGLMVIGLVGYFGSRKLRKVRI